MAEVEAEFGAGTSLDDFERKAQMLNYVNHRAIFEGMNAHLWAPNSGRMLWMTQPAWPSNMWQILSSDYDTQASYYGTKKACEPLHIQMDPSDYSIAVVNNTTVSQPGLTITANIYSLDNKLLLQHVEQKDATPNAVTAAFRLDLPSLLVDHVVLVKLEARASGNRLLSENFYWVGATSASYRQLTRLPAAHVSAHATFGRSGSAMRVLVQLKNEGASAALANKLTLLNAGDGSRILPAYYSDNYVSLLPGETRNIEIEYPAGEGNRTPMLTLRGWNLSSQKVEITAQN
jgi:hypothetical protein